MSSSWRTLISLQFDRSRKINRYPSSSRSSFKIQNGKWRGSDCIYRFDDRSQRVVTPRPKPILWTYLQFQKGFRLDFFFEKTCFIHYYIFLRSQRLIHYIGLQIIKCKRKEVIDLIWKSVTSTWRVIPLNLCGKCGA